MSEIINDLKSRYTVKQYDPSKKVSEEDMKVILESAWLSASSINSQPWKFISIESQEAKERLNSTFSRMHQFNQKHVFDSSAVILFCFNPKYKREDFEHMIQQEIKDERLNEESAEKRRGSFMFVESNTDTEGYNRIWTRSQLYISLGNVLHTLARLHIGSTPLEGIDSELISEVFAEELHGYECPVALAIGYPKSEEDYNAHLAKSRLPKEEIIIRL